MWRIIVNDARSSGASGVDLAPGGAHSERKEDDIPANRCAEDSYTVNTFPDVPNAGRSTGLRL